MNKGRILIVDDDVEVRTLISDILADDGYDPYCAANEVEAIKLLSGELPDVVFLDLWINNDESAGIKILNKINKINRELPVIMISGHGSIDVAVSAIKKGAFDFIEKPFVIDRMLLACKNAVEMQQLKKENKALKCKNDDINVFSAGKSQFASAIKHQILKIAQTNSRVFIKADVGNFAESIALAIHRLSDKKDQNFMSINCSSFSDSDMIDTLFGNKDLIGIIERVDGGSLHLSDISALGHMSQRRFLQFLQDASCCGCRGDCVDVRIIVSDTHSGYELCKGDCFSNELLHRINITSIDIPNVVDRREDIMHIVNYYLSKAEHIFGLRSKQFEDDAIAMLESYFWPGNVLQIKNIVENSLIKASSLGEQFMHKECLPREMFEVTKDEFESLDVAKLIALPLKDAKDMFESDYLRAQIQRFSGNITQTANFIGMERSALHRKLRSLNVMIDRKKVAA